jgi:transposase
MSATYAAVYTVTLPKAAQVVDTFHLISLANRSLDATRRRVQIEQLGHRGRRDDPLYRARRLLLIGEEKLKDEASERLSSLLELGDPGAEVAIAYRVKERRSDFYRTGDPDEAKAMLAELQAHCTKKAMPPEIQKLGRNIKKWFDKIANLHLARVSNGPTESLNNLIKRIKRIGFGFRNFENYRIRALLYAGKPNWRARSSFSEQADPARIRRASSLRGSRSAHLGPRCCAKRNVLTGHGGSRLTACLLAIVLRVFRPRGSDVSAPINQIDVASTG